METYQEVMYFHLIFSPTQNLAHKAAKECSYVNPHKIMEILEVPLSTSSGSQAVDGKYNLRDRRRLTVSIIKDP